MTMLELRAEAIRWEHEGMLGSSRGRSQSVPSIHGVQYAMHGGHRPISSSSTAGSELSELKDMLRCQQEQLNQLSECCQSVAMLQHPQQRPCSNPIICRWCQQPGHFARDCDGPQVPPRAQAFSAVHSRSDGQSPPRLSAEN